VKRREVPIIGVEQPSQIACRILVKIETVPIIVDTSQREVFHERLTEGELARNLTRRRDQPHGLSAHRLP
jgi:hypothetical protein